MEDLDSTELTDQVKEKLVIYQGSLVKIIEAYESLEKSQEWATLKELVFDKEIASIERKLVVASLETPLNEARLYRLQGERLQAKKYEVTRHIETLKKQLDDINKRIK